MCEKCASTVEKYLLPWIDEKDISDLLIGATCFPFKYDDSFVKQVKELGQRRQECLSMTSKEFVNWAQFRACDQQLDLAMEKLRHKKESEK